MADEGDRREERGFKVEDRRRFSPGTGASRESAERSESSASSDEKVSQEEARAAQTSASREISEISFSTFVIGLSTQALMHLGEIPDPLSGKVESDITVAKQMIDIIGMLQDKTRGNLAPGEEKLMEDILFDLRMRYVEAVNKK